MGEFEYTEHGGPPPGGGAGRSEGRGQPDAKQLLQQMETNKDGKLTVEEAKGPLKQEFSNIDANDDGYISIEELTKGLSREKRQN